MIDRPHGPAQRSISLLVRRGGGADGPRTWAIWSLPPLLRIYVVAVPAVAALLLLVLLPRGLPPGRDPGIFAILLAGAAASIEVSRRLREPVGVHKDVLSTWWLPIAVLLPPAYALLAPIPLMALTQWRVRRAVVHRRVFSAASIGLAYAAGSSALHALPAQVGWDPSSPWGPLGWVLAVLACGVAASAVNFCLVAPALDADEISVPWREVLWRREDVLLDVVEVCTGVLVALAVHLTPALVVIALPPVFLLQRSMLHAQLRNAARLDSKTGLFNSITWEREAAAELSRSYRSRRSAAVLLVDLDHFKRVNDTYGHLAGDEVLRRVAEVLRSQIREGDVLGRFGGEEFAVLLPDADAGEARKAAERLRQQVAELIVPVRPSPTAGETSAARVSVSIGVAVADVPDLTVTDLLAAADIGLYAAKGAGRDQVATAHSRRQLVS